MIVLLPFLPFFVFFCFVLWATLPQSEHERLSIKIKKLQEEYAHEIEDCERAKEDDPHPAGSNSEKILGQRKTLKNHNRELLPLDGKFSTTQAKAQDGDSKQQHERTESWNSESKKNSPPMFPSYQKLSGSEQKAQDSNGKSQLKRIQLSDPQAHKDWSPVSPPSVKSVAFKGDPQDSKSVRMSKEFKKPEESSHITELEQSILSPKPLSDAVVEKSVSKFMVLHSPTR